jgi:hypothetical protein
MTQQATQATPASGGGNSTHEIIQQLAEQLSHLVRDEVKLAEAEMTRKGKRVAKGAGLFGGSGVVALYGAGCLIAAAVAGLATVLAVWLAALIVAAVLFGCAGLAALAGKREVSHATPLVPEQTIASVQADAETITEGMQQ